jgi:oligopeptide transport system substrate-binding protein
MYQVPENTELIVAPGRQVIEYARKFVGVPAIFLCAAIIVACGSHSESGGRGSGVTPLQGDRNVQRTLKRGLPGEPRTLDPQSADDTYSFQVIRDLYEGLTAESPSGDIVPGTASSWTVDSTGTIYTFQLRPDARWSNGDRLVAAEFVEGLRHAVDPKTASGSAAMLTAIKGASEITSGRRKVVDLGASAIGDSVIQIELEHPAPYLLEILSQPIAAPLHANSKLSRAGGRPQDAGALTNGPYVLVKRVPGSIIELARNSQYWDSAHVAIESVRYVNAESEATELREYTAGELDMTFTIPMPDLKRITQQYPDEVQTAPVLATLYLALNLSKPPLNTGREVRQALSMAVDREFIAEQVLMGVTPAYAFVARGISGYQPPSYPWSSWSRDERLAYAKNLYANAGYSAKNPLKLKLYFNRDEGIQRVMVAIAASWKQNLGVESELLTDEFRVFLVGRKDKTRWDVSRLGWTADYNDPTSFLNVFARGSGQNDPNWASPKFNETMDRAEVEPRNDMRSDLLRQSEQILLDDYPIIPIYFYKARRLVKPYVGGATITPMNRTYTKHLFWKNAP